LNEGFAEGLKDGLELGMSTGDLVSWVWLGSAATEGLSEGAVEFVGWELPVGR
jgi:hypothetical protein